MRPWKIAFILLLVAIALMIAVAWREVRHGFSARTEPSAIEIFMATATQN